MSRFFLLYLLKAKSAQGGFAPLNPLPGLSPEPAGAFSGPLTHGRMDLHPPLENPGYGPVFADTRRTGSILL